MANAALAFGRPQLARRQAPGLAMAPATSRPSAQPGPLPLPVGRQSAHLRPTLPLLPRAGGVDAGCEIVPDQAILPVDTALLAERVTRKLRMANGMEIYLVSDPGVEESSASLTVRAGSWQDPDEYPGTAHFLEHMLFMGTEKYPDEAEYERYLNEHGGTFNAYTAGDHTLYGFSCKNAGFEGAVDRFSNFFKAPLLKASCLERERNAVDQEFSGYKEMDARRAHLVHNALSNPKHPASRFTIGNQQTLGSLDSATLRAWYEQHYSANLMHLVLYSPLPLDQLERLACDNFGTVPNRHLEPFKVEAPTGNPANEGQLLYIAAQTKNAASLSLEWNIDPELARNQEAAPAQTLAYVLSHGGANSLQTKLKEAGLVREVGAYPNYSLTGSATFSLYCALTDEGVRRRDEVIAACYAALHQLRDRGVPDYLFDEMCQSSLRAHRFQSRSNAYNTAQSHGQGLLYEGIATYPDKSVAPERLDRAAIARTLSALKPERCSTTLTAHPDVARLPADRAERWMGTRFSLRPVPAATLEAWDKAQAPNADFALPPPNRFIPTNLRLVPTDAMSPTSKRPKLVVDDDRATIYFARDVRELTPEVSWTIDIKTPLLDNPSPRIAVLRDVHLALVRDALGETLAAANMANLDARAAPTEGGIAVTVQGFSDKAFLLLDDTLQALKKSSPTQAKFQEITSSLANAYHDALTSNPNGVAYEQLNLIRYKNAFSQAQRLKALETIRLSDVVEFGRRLFDTTYVQASLMGNMAPADVEGVQSCLALHLDGAPYPEGRTKRHPLRSLPNAPIRIDYPAATNDSTVLLTLEQGPFDVNRGAAQDLLTQALSQRFFDELRTKQQTGYQVSAFNDNIDNTMYSHFLVKPHHHANPDVLARIEQFIESFANEIGHSQVTEQEFNTLKAARLAALTAPPRTMLADAKRLHSLAFERERDFQFVDKRAQAMASLQYADFVKYAKAALGAQNRQRLAVLATGKVPPMGAPVYTSFASAEEVLAAERATS